MSDETIEQHQFTRRALVLAGLQGAGLALLLGRLTYVQLVQGDKYQTLAEDNRIATRLIVPPRGQIIDRFGMVVADNAVNYQAVLTPEQTADLELLLTRFTQYIPLADDEQKRIRRDLRRHRAFTPVLLKDHLTWDEVAKLELHLHELTGVAIETGVIRYYPYTGATAHVLGYVGPVSEREQEARKDEPILQVPGYMTGKGGLERQYESTLSGKAGNQQREVNAHGRIIRELAHTPPVAGEALRVTLDGVLQLSLQERLALEKSAAGVVMDVQSGAIYALASHPSFDPNEFTRGIDAKLWRTLLNDETAPLTNKVISGQYAPGSTYKMVVALAALEEGISPSFNVSCNGHIDLGNHRFHCWKREGHGRVDLHEALKVSCDVWFYEVGRRLGVDKVSAVARRLGLGASTGLDMPGERRGLIPTTAWKRARFNQPWHRGEDLVAAIGQGYVLATPLQLAMMTARLVNGGRAVTPHLTAGAAATSFADLGFKPSFLDVIKRAMDGVVNETGGTALGSKVKAEEAALAFGGKTGTSQVRRISRAERATGVIPNELRPWRERDHALFVGYAPIAAPRFAAAVIVEHGGGGSKVAAPIARDILLLAQKRFS